MEERSEKLPPELVGPNFSNVFRIHVIVPILVYFVLFRFASRYVKTHYWQSFKGFKRYRLHNLSICFLHALIVGTLNLLVMLTHPYEAYHEIIEWWSPFASQIPLMSVAYFIHDAIDMLSYEWSKWTLELLFHHSATCLALLCPSISDRFLFATSWALLMEINSIFLHARTILQICGLSTKFPKVYEAIVYLNITTFFLFRIVFQLIFAYWAFTNRHRMHLYYLANGLLGEIVFAFINGLLLIRLLASDGLMPKNLRNKFAMTRDKSEDDDVKKQIGNGKKRD
ncbi:unnamed protein product [Caenorhabditis bovis]|uniref:TLC domain-containing protein n=1 Tax=Caenorhabditis bovis TaxID=2654633 RepID=A0A8S1F5B0_9PELO|nr:unnamed protein product [Caenorhabditis bovis]